MNKPELRSIKNTALLSKPSTAIPLLLMVLFVCLFVNFASAQKTWDGGGDNVNWNSANNWNPNGIPTSTDAVTLTNNNAVTVNIPNAVCASVQLGGTGGNTRGILTFAASGNPSLTVVGAITMGGSNGNANRSGTITFVSGSTLICGSLTLGNSNNSPSTLTMSANSTLRTGSLSVGGTGTTWTPSTGTVVLTANNTLPTTIFTSFNSLTINSGETTFGAATTITSNFSINPGARVNLGIFTHTAGTLRFAGTAQLPESFGATISPADNKNNIYFAATIGIVNNSCTPPAITSQPIALTICENSGGSFGVTTSTSSPTYQWQYSVDAGVNWINTTGVAGFSGHTSATLTLSNIPASYNGYRVRCIVRSSSGCRTNSNSALLTVNAIPSAPTIGTITQPTCSTATASVLLNDLPSGNWQLTRSPGNVITTGAGASTTISGLTAGTTYTYAVNSLNNGLKGEYYNNMTLTGVPLLTRTDATVGFDWGTGSPAVSIGNDNFSVRWSGLVQPLVSETYTFSTRSDDGIRLWVNGVQIINNWTDHAPTINTGTIALTAGVKYNIVLEYYENVGGAVSQLSWSSPTNPTSVIIPSTQLFHASSCTSPASANVVINAQPAIPSAPTIGTITHSTCTTPLGSVVLSALPASGTISQTGTVSEIYAITGTTMTISGLAPGTYNFAASDGICTSSATANVVINAFVAVINTYNGSWNNGPPNSSQVLIFAAGYSSPSDVSGCSCQVNTGVNVTINNPHTLTITNAVNVLGTGTLTFDYDNTFGVNPISSASLVQINNVTNSGNIIYRRRTNTNVISTDYTYWSSPVIGQTMFNLSPNTLPSMFYSYQATATGEGWQQESSGNTMAPGLGYSIGGPNVITPPDTYLATFAGVPNNGTITLSNVFANKSYLLGNPYPSAIDADAFLNQNATVLGGTLYFWTHNTDLQDRNNIAATAGSGLLAYTSDDYATYNITGGVGIDPGSTTSAAISPGANTSIPSGKIAAGQGFFASTQVLIPAGSSIVFNNTIRLAGEIAGVKNNDQFFKTRNPASKTSNTIEKHRVWLNLTNTQGAFKQTLIGYITDATNEYDSRFDGESFDGNNFVDFYSINREKNLTIQGRALPFDENDEVPLGYRTTINGNFTINIGQTDGLLANQNVFLEDKLVNKTVNLKEEKYTFNTAAGTFDDRFVLRYTNKTLGTSTFDSLTNTVLVSYKNKQIKINSFAETIDKVTIYDLLGRQIYQKEKVNSNELSIANLASSHQTLVVKTSLQNGKVVTEKIVY